MSEPTICKPSIYNGQTIYNNGGGGGGGIPIIDPTLYKQLSYIEVNGNADPSFRYVFRYKTTDKLKISCEVTPINLDDDRNFAVVYLDTFTQYYQYVKSSNKSYFHYDFNDWPYTGNVNINVRLSNWLNLSWKIKENVGYFSLNDSTQTVNNPNAPSERDIIIFSMTSHQYFIGTKFYRCTVYDGETEEIKLDYVPCLRISDNKLGIYEIYSQAFKAPYGNNPYNAGPAV